MPTTPVLALPYPAGTAPDDPPYDFQQLGLALDTLLGSAWTAYTPTWGASTNPSIGNGTIAGRFRQIGKTVSYSVKITMGSTTTYGSGSYTITLPVNCFSGVGAACGEGGIFDTSGGVIYGILAVAVGANSVGLWDIGGATGSSRVTATAPITLATGDTITIGGTYEAA